MADNKNHANPRGDKFADEFGNNRRRRAVPSEQPQDLMDTVTPPSDDWSDDMLGRRRNGRGRGQG